MKRLKKIFEKIYPLPHLLVIMTTAYWLLSNQRDKIRKRNEGANGLRIEQLWGDVSYVQQTKYVVWSDSLIFYQKQYLRFDEYGNCTEKIISNPNDGLFKIFLFQNNELNQTTEIIENDTEGNMFRKTLFIYDSDGFLVEKLIYNRHWQLYQKIIYIYNSDSEKTTEILFDSAETKVLEKKYLYTNGKCSSEIIMNELDGSRVEIPYDDNGNPLIEKDFTIKYEYDWDGSWVKKSVYRNNELISIEERNIKYRDDE